MFHSALPRPLRITVLQGEARASADPAAEFGTVLGSCVAACLFDATAALGGMNHFLLAQPPASMSAADVDEHFGVYLMEVLINEMLAHGASKARLRAHLYGGANLHPAFACIGTRNAAFARRFLLDEGIPLVRQDLGGTCARRVDFRPATGQVRCRQIHSTQAPDQQPASRASRDAGDVELF